MGSKGKLQMQLPILLASPLLVALSVGILLGSIVILASWFLTYIYIRWANKHYDQRLDALKRSAQ